MAGMAMPQAMPAMPMGAPIAPMAGPLAPGLPAPIGDPIAEAPAAIWYVRPPTGSQYGPARGDVMRKWIVEGRVSSDSLVWRGGMTGWTPARQTAELAGLFPPPPPPA